ncbi:uncharacterized protein LOC104585411 [Brachypodium distachyon]|nr:uncharacterized protein LOC104585411 [Brachypodium distachyon]|eukprot:XP_024311213.1 uncharacterized protein LOC104585411 [Brachypodium distachyon]
MEGKEHESSATVLDASLETITQNVKNVPAGSAELSSKAATSVDSTEFQAKTPDIPPGCSLIPTISSDGGAPSLPYVPSAKKSNIGKKTKTKL